MAYQDALLALGDPTRRAVYERVLRKSLSVGEMAKELPVSRPAVSQHLKVLSDAGLVEVRREGTRRIYSAAPQGLAELRTYLDGLWDDVLQAYANSFSEDDDD